MDRTLVAERVQASNISGSPGRSDRGITFGVLAEAGVTPPDKTHCTAVLCRARINPSWGENFCRFSLTGVYTQSLPLTKSNEICYGGGPGHPCFWGLTLVPNLVVMVFPMHKVDL